jgi:tetrahydromethanopterin S-methyltransferase subunit G
MDDFAAHTDRRFDAVDKRLDRLERRVDKGFDQIDGKFDQVNSRIDSLHQTIHRTMLLLGVGMITTLALGLIGVIVTH